MNTARPPRGLLSEWAWAAIARLRAAGDGGLVLDFDGKLARAGPSACGHWLGRDHRVSLGNQAIGPEIPCRLPPKAAVPLCSQESCRDFAPEDARSRLGSAGAGSGEPAGEASRQSAPARRMARA